MRKLAICLAALLVTASPWSGANEATDYPKKTVRIIVPLGAGGAVDVLARLLGARLADAWGQQFIVENRPGATGSVGASAVSKAPGDGYTLLVTTNSPLTTNLALYQKLDYTIDDFEPVRLLAVAPVALLVQAASPIKSAADFIALAKQAQGVSVATTGNGSIGHFLINEMRRSLGANFIHVPYKGGVPGAAAVVSGESQAGMDPELIRQLVNDCKNIVCIKAEGGMPTVGGFIQCWKRHAHEVLVTVPIEAEMIPLAALLPIQWGGTSNYELFRDRIPILFKLMRAGAFEEAMQGWWQLHPIRMAHSAAQASHMPGTKLLHRTYWKYQGWLNGFNGGPLRQPTQKLVDAHMRSLRAALKAGGLEPTPEPDAEFFVGRNPA
jgi:Tripartite tricarboxylate transporter family receptor